MLTAIEFFKKTTKWDTLHPVIRDYLENSVDEDVVLIIGNKRVGKTMVSNMLVSYEIYRLSCDYFYYKAIADTLIPNTMLNVHVTDHTLGYILELINKSDVFDRVEVQRNPKEILIDGRIRITTDRNFAGRALYACEIDNSESYTTDFVKNEFESRMISRFLRCPSDLSRRGFKMWEILDTERYDKIVNLNLGDI